MSQSTPKLIRQLALGATAAVLLIVNPATSQDAPTTQPAATQPADGAGPGSAEDVLNELLRRRADNPLIEPARPIPAEPVRATTGDTQGTAPGVRPTHLYREGQFLVNRRGRLAQAVGAASPWAFHFDADSSGLAEPPVYILPCRLLEDAEKIVQERGDETEFILSGTAYAYRGANYILPTMIQQASNRGNLQR